MKLFAEVTTCDKLITQIQEKITGYRIRNPFSNKKTLREKIRQLIVDESLLVKQREENLTAIIEHQKHMKNPPIHIINSPSPNGQPNK